jgi:hypothetical protein
MPEPSAGLEQNMKKDLDWSQRTKVTKITKINLHQKAQLAVIKKLQEQLASEIPDIEKRKKLIKLNLFLR